MSIPDLCVASSDVHDRQNEHSGADTELASVLVVEAAASGDLLITDLVSACTRFRAARSRSYC